jgi:hypothetical protein
MRRLACLSLLAACLCPPPAAAASFARAARGRRLRFLVRLGLRLGRALLSGRHRPAAGRRRRRQGVAWRGSVFTRRAAGRRARDERPARALLRRRLRRAPAQGRPLREGRIHRRCARGSQPELDKGSRGRLRPRRDGFDHRFAGCRAPELLDLTGLASDWATGVAPNRGVLLKLAEEEEDFGVSGPYFPSASFGTATLRPRLVVSCIVPTTGLSP